MKIGIDVRCLSGGKRTGVEEYILNLLPAIFKFNKKIQFILYFNSFKKSQVDFSWIEKYSNVSIKKTRFPNKLLNFSLWYFNWPKIDKILGGVDFFFLPNISFIALSKKTKLILTVHDLSFEKHSEFFSFKRRLWHIFLNPVKLTRKADKIIAISQSTKNDLINNYNLDPKKIELVYSGLSNKFKVINRNNPKLIEIKEKYGLPFKFIFYLGTMEPRKNVPAILEAFNQLKKWAKKKNNQEVANIKLVLAGTPGWLEKKTIKAIECSPFRKDVFKINFIEEEDKVFIYNLANIFIFPSFLEGFGFPPLEAQKSGLPVIVSANSSFPETVNNSAFMIDPDRPEEIMQTLKNILINKKLKENLIHRD
jgi:glycosyltransferase involved in cell wall biosynthesis